VRVAVTSLIVAALAGTPAVAEVRSSFAYELSDSSGIRPLSWPALRWDTQHQELYAVDGRNGVVEVFNDAGMSIYSFGEDSALGWPIDVAVADNGGLIVLAADNGHWKLVRCNFRGDPVAPLVLTNFPAAFEKDYTPGTLIGAAGKLYLADKAHMRVLVFSQAGVVESALNLGPLLRLTPKRLLGLDMRGFNVDSAGNLLFTVPSLFQAFVVSPEGKIRSFGTRGSSPGKFNIVAGITADERGNFWLLDSLRAVVMVFDPDFRFLGEFGYRGYDDDNLIAPNDLVVAGNRVFVNQSIGGVKAFDVLIQ
jgi:hypothetical protein